MEYREEKGLPSVQVNVVQSMKKDGMNGKEYRQDSSEQLLRYLDKKRVLLKSKKEKKDADTKRV